MKQYCECGRPALVRLHPGRNPHSSKLGRAVAIPQHPICRQCWRSLIAPHLTAQQVAKEAARHGA